MKKQENVAAQEVAKNGDLRVWWIPQIPMKPFRVAVKSVEQAMFLMDVLAEYDAYQFENNIKPDYSNTGGLERYDSRDIDGGDPETGWTEWCNDEGDSIDEVWRAARQ